MTKETEKAFKILYCEYKRRRKEGASKQSAVQFEESEIKTIPVFSKWHPSDIVFAMQELKKAGYVSMNICGDIELLETGIEFMEEKPKDFFLGIADFFDLASILGIVTGI